MIMLFTECKKCKFSEYFCGLGKYKIRKYGNEYPVTGKEFTICPKCKEENTLTVKEYK